VSHAVGVISENHPILAHLSVSELFREGQAEVPGTTLIMGGLGLVRGRRDVDFEAGHALLG